MSAHPSSKAKVKTIGEIHRTLVDQLLSSSKPVGHVPAVWKQWALWLVSTLILIGLVLLKIELQENLPQILGQMPPLAFLATAFLGAALAAWQAIASSVPGRQTGKWQIFLSLFMIGVLFLIPFIFFGHGLDGFGWSSVQDGFGCFTTASLVGVFPWILLGWMISRNAAFHPAWSGAWSGVSAFLMGTFTIQLHCPNWQADHMVLAHLLPVACFIFLTTGVGAFWFSRWRK
jgi:hypothetical protein